MAQPGSGGAAWSGRGQASMAAAAPGAGRQVGSGSPTGSSACGQEHLSWRGAGSGVAVAGLRSVHGQRPRTEWVWGQCWCSQGSEQCCQPWPIKQLGKFTTVVLTLRFTLDSPGGLVKPRFLVPTRRGSAARRCGVGLKMYSNQSQEGAVLLALRPH